MSISPMAINELTSFRNTLTDHFSSIDVNSISGAML